MNKNKKQKKCLSLLDALYLYEKTKYVNPYTKPIGDMLCYGMVAGMLTNNGKDLKKK